MIQFGSGLLLLNPVGGNLANNPTPIQPLILQDVSLDISIDLKELRGQNRAPDDVAPGDMKISGKFSFAQQNYSLINQIFFAETSVAGGTAIVPREQQTIPAASTYTVTVSHAANFATDLGVVYLNGGSPFTRVTSAPTQGQYSVAAGVYTFSSADAGTNVLISYGYSQNTVGRTLTLHNQLMGYGPVFEMYLAQPYQSYQGIPNSVHLFSCRASKSTLGTKRADYGMQEMDYMAFANASGQIAELFQAWPS